MYESSDFSSNGPALLLCSGAGLPPFIWDDVRYELPGTVSVSVASRPNGPSVTMEDVADQALNDAPAEQFVVVGHSLGAAVGLAIAAAAPERVLGLLAIAGVVPRAGKSFLAAMPFPNRLVLSVMMRLAGTRPPDRAIRRVLCAGVCDDAADRIVDHYQPEAQGVFRSPVPDGRQPSVRGYVRTTDDRELPTSLQDRFHATLGPHWTTTLNTGHLAMLQDPLGVAEAITTFSAMTSERRTRLTGGSR